MCLQLCKSGPVFLKKWFDVQSVKLSACVAEEWLDVAVFRHCGKTPERREVLIICRRSEAMQFKDILKKSLLAGYQGRDSSISLTFVVCGP